MQIIDTKNETFEMASIGMTNTTADYGVVSATWIDWRGVSGTNQSNSNTAVLTIQDNPVAIKPLVNGKMMVWFKGLASDGATDGYMSIRKNSGTVEITQRVEAGSNFTLNGLIECTANQWIQPRCDDNFTGGNMIFSCIFIPD